MWWKSVKIRVIFVGFARKDKKWWKIWLKKLEILWDKKYIERHVFCERKNISKGMFSKRKHFSWENDENDHLKKNNQKNIAWQNIIKTNTLNSWVQLKGFFFRGNSCDQLTRSIDFHFFLLKGTSWVQLTKYCKSDLVSWTQEIGVASFGMSLKVLLFIKCLNLPTL